MTNYPPLGFSLSDLFSLAPDVTLRVLNSPYFIYLLISAVLIGVWAGLALMRYRDSICLFLNRHGLRALSNFLGNIH
jgi:hypothetical protein